MTIYQSLASIMLEVDAIGKNKNSQQGYKFRGIDDVYNTIHPIFGKYGVFTVPTVLSERSEERQTKNGSTLIYRVLSIKYTFFSSDGSSVDAVVIGEGMDSGDKAANKAMAVAHKYALLQILCIPTEDMVDPDSETPEPTTKAPRQTRQQPARQASRQATQPVHTQPPSMITTEQSMQMQALAERMADPAGKAYLMQKSASPIPYAEADEIIRRATASLGGK